MNLGRRMITIFSVTLSLFISFPTFALTTKSRQLHALESLLIELDLQYGMELNKIENLGVTIDTLRETYSRAVEEALTVEELWGLEEKVDREILTPDQFRSLMINLVAQLADGHVNIMKLTRNTASLGIYTAAMKGRLFVTGLSDYTYVKGASELEVKPGDEIVEFNGEPVEQAALRILPYVQNGTFEARRSDALEWLTLRPYFFVPKVKEGELVTIKFKRGNQEFEGHFPWVETEDLQMLQAQFPDKFLDPSSASLKDAPFLFGRSGTVRSAFREGLDKLGLPDGTIIDMGRLLNAELSEAQQKKSPGPPQSAQITPVQRIPAYIVNFQGKRVGVIRIPSYSPGPLPAMVNEYKWIEKIVARMENSTDVLIIDHNHNSGGMLYYGEHLLQIFAGKDPLQSLSINYKLSETMLMIARPGVRKDPVDGKPPNHAELRLSQKVYNQLREKYERGERWSGNMPIMESGVSLDTNGRKIFPHPHVRYTKPILTLNDRQSASLGDMVPRVLQASRRAVIFGETSSGLGGPVNRKYDSFPGLEMEFRATIGHVTVHDGSSVENIGAIPDIPRAFRPADLREGFRSYALDALQVAVGLSDGKAPRELAQKLQEEEFKSFPELQGIEEQQKTLREMIENFQSQERYLELSQKSTLTKAEAKELAGLINSFFKKIKKHVKKSELRPEQWRNMMLKLPFVAVSNDEILAALVEYEEVLNRLDLLADNKLMAKHKGPELTLIYRTLRNGIRSLPARLRYADPCALML